MIQGINNNGINPEYNLRISANKSYNKAAAHAYIQKPKETQMRKEAQETITTGIPAQFISQEYLNKKLYASLNIKSANSSYLPQ